MNIVFTDYFSERAWHATIQASQENREEIHRRLADSFIDGAWCDREPVATVSDRHLRNYPDMYSFAGRYMTRVRISCCPNDCTVLDGEPIAAEFTWQLQRQEVDKYGYPQTEEWKPWILGGLINHARYEKWVSPVTGKVTRQGDPLWEVVKGIGEQARKDAYRLPGFEPSLRPDWERRQTEPSWSVHT